MNFKKTVSTILCMLFATLVIAIIPTEAEASIYDDTLRLHILANSDSDFDQNIKLQVRDLVLSKFGQQLKIQDSLESAKETAEKLKPDITSEIDSFLASKKINYKSTVEIKTEWFDKRVYEHFTLPCGYYQSLIIYLGQGQGHNWWCVMYPPLCLDISTSDKYTTEENSLIKTKKYNLKFKILELISESLKDLP